MDRYRKVCVYNIAANEIKFVDKWFSSMLEADYITCLVTKSEDGTLEKMKEYEKKYPEKVKIEYKEITPWRFDVARNESMKLIPDDAEILVTVDLDEYMEPGWAQTLRENWRDTTRRCTYKYIWSHMEDGSPGRIFYYNKIHGKGWIYRFPVHEMLWDPINHTASYSAAESINLFNQITLHHFPDRTKSRGSYLPLLELREKEDPEDYYGKIYLANEYVYRGHYEKALEKFHLILTEFADRYNSIEKASCYLFSGDCYLKLNKKEEAISSYIQAIKVEPTYREPNIGLMKVLEEMKQWDLARAVGIEALKKTYRHFTWLERDTSWTYELYDLMSIACFYGDHKLESIAYATKALQFCPENERLKNNLKICLEKTKDSEFTTN